MGKILQIVLLLSSFTVILSKSTQKSLKVEAGVNPITLDDVLSGKYSAASYSGSWISDTLLEYRNGSDIWTHDILTNERKLKFDASIFSQYGSFDYSFSTDGNFALIIYDREAGWRHSFTAHYDIYDITAKKFTPVFPKDLPEKEKLMLFKWAPTGNSFVYVYNGNIYHRESASVDGEYKLTTTGTLDGSIVNGHTDWVYEEEMFGESNALWFSPDSKYLSYIEFDDTLVEKFQYPMYGEPGDQEHAYPEWIEIRYPKAGSTNPSVKMYTIDLSSTDKTAKVVTYEDLSETDRLNRHYIGAVSWKADTSFLLLHLNRKQNVSVWYDCQVGTSLCSKLDPAVGQTEQNGWVDVSYPTFSTDKTKFLVILPKAILTHNNLRYRQIFKVDLSTKTSTSITNEPISVDSILAWDETNGKIYFSGTGLTDNKPSPSESQTYFVEDKENSISTCITCSLKNSDEIPCKSNRISLSTGFVNFLHYCSGPEIPEVHVRNISHPTYAIVRSIEANDALRDKIQETNIPVVLDEEIEIPGFMAKTRLYLPPDYDQNKQYPLFIDVYAGPDSQKISEGYSVSWGTSLVTDKEIIYGYIDGRGSGRQSREQLFQLNRNLGTVEIEDQIKVTAELIKRHKFINPNETAIWGWSYGGYATAMVMATDTDNVFKCGISVAPVTNWLYYDTIYTERYMSLPTEEDNWKGYNQSDVTTHVDNFRNKKFLLVHGNADDNVHYANSMMLSRALEKADIMFNQLSYPDEDHSIAGPGMRRHLYHSLEQFLFSNCFHIEAEGGHKDNGSQGLMSTFSLHIYVFLAGLLYFRI